MKIEKDILLSAGAEQSGIDGHVKQASVKGTVRCGRTDVGARLQVLRQEADRSAEILGTDGRRVAGAAIEIHAANPLPREEHPGVMRGIVGVLERDAIEGHRILTVFEAAEKS